MCRIQKFSFIVLFITLFLLSLGDNCEAFYPLKTKYWKSSNFGEYRKPTYPLHDGIDIAAPPGTSVYSIKDGAVFRIAYDVGYGKNVIVKHNDGTYSRYCHLSSYNVEENQSVTISTIIAKTGSSGTTSPHLHFEYMNSAKKKINPLSAGLEQPNNGDAYIKKGASKRNGKLTGDYNWGVYFLTPGEDGRFETNDDLVWINGPMHWEDGEPIRIVVEAYDGTKPNAFSPSRYTTPPYKIDFEIEDIEGNCPNDYWGKSSEYLIDFGSIAYDVNSNWIPNIGSLRTSIFSFGPSPFITQGYGAAAGPMYFYWKWYPKEEGMYTLKVRVYDAYDGTGPNGTETDSVERTLNIGLAGIDYITGPVAVSVPSTEEVIIHAVQASPLYFSPNPGNIIFPDSVHFFGKANKEVDWTVKIFNSGDSLVKEINAGHGEILKANWDGFGVWDGDYTYKIIAKDSGGNEAEIEGQTITVDQTSPSFSYGPTVTPFITIQSSAEITGIEFSTNEELYSVLIKLVDHLDNELAILASIPGLQANTTYKANWDWPGSVPNGEYKFKIEAVDVAGNQLIQTSSAVQVNIPGNDSPPPTGLPPVEEPVTNLPELPAWEDRPIISDIAFDSAGNQYVLYGRYNKLVKYDSAGDVVKTVDEFDLTPNDMADNDHVKLRLPLGLAVSPSGDRVYAADTYNRRILMFDGNLQPLAELAGQNVYIMEKTHRFYYYWPVIRVREVRGGPDEVKNAGVGDYFFLPSSIKVSTSGDVYVGDKNGHRVFKYDNNLEGKIFSNIILDASNEQKLEDWKNKHGSEAPQLVVQIVEKFFKELGNWLGGEEETFELKFRSNEINDLIYPNTNNYMLTNSKHLIPGWGMGVANGQLTSPESVAVDSSGYIYVSDTGNNRIQKFASDGSFVSKFGEGILNSPHGICIDEDNHIWVADTGNKRIQEFKLDGTFIRSWGNSKILSKPLKLAVKKEGDTKVVYVADGDKDEVQVFGVSPPKNFKIITEEERMLIPERTLSISWEASEDNWFGLKEYQVLGRKADWEEGDFGVLVNHISPEETSTSVDLMVDDVWQIKVRAINNRGLWTDTQTIEVKVDSAPPGPVSLAFPYDGEYFDGRNVTINWNSAEDADLDYYEVCIGTDPDDIHGSAVFSENFTPEVTSCEVNLLGGVYYIYIAAYDKAGHWRNLKGETDIPDFDLEPAIAFENAWPMFEIDHEPPLIAYDPTVLPPATNSHFSPNADGKKDSTIINYYVGDDSYWRVNYLRMDEVRIDIRGEIVKDGEVVRSWTSRSPPGWNEFAWDGSSPLPLGEGAGVRAPDGTYTIKITATDKALNTATDESLTVAVDTTPPEINNIANSGVFSPNGDGEFDTDTLSFELSDNLAEELATTVDVLNPANVVIRSLVAGSDSMSVVWDGKSGPLHENGEGGPSTQSMVGEGTYTYLITTTDQAGNASIATTNITIDTTPPAIADVSTSPKREVTFTETSGALDINFTVSEPANVRLAIYDSNYSIIRDYVVEVEPGGANTISWDGRDSFGSLVPDNTYITYAFSATDQVANSSTYASNDIVKVDTPVTGMAGNIIYSPDGAVKIIIPAGAVVEGTELYLDMFDTPPETYKVNEMDNITLTYKLYPENLELNKQATMVIHYDESVLNFEDQPVELWKYGSGWTKLYGNTGSDVFTAYIEKTGEFALFADLTPPAPPVIAQPASPTKDGTITISGTSEPYSKVDLWINGLKRSPPINAGVDGNFSTGIVLLEGQNSIYGQATDQTGNVGSDSGLISVELDTIPPTITLNSPQYIYISPDGDGIQDEATISANTDGISIVISVRDGQNNILASSNSGTLTVDGGLLTVDGVYPYVVKAFDELGNEALKDGEIIVDTIPPDAYLYSSVITPIVSGKLPLSALADDLNFARYVLDYGAGGSPTSWTWLNESFINVVYQKIADVDTALLEDDTYTFRLLVYDKAGNSNSSTLSKQTVNDELYGSISFPIINQVIGGTIEIHGNITGTNFAEYRVEYGVGENPISWQIITSATTLPADSLLATWDTTSVSDGNYTLKLRVINIGGGTSDHTVPVKVDNSLPAISISSPQPDQVLADTINISGSIVDENFSYYKVEYASQASPADWYLIKDTTYTLASPLASWNTTAVNDGNYLIKLTAVDVVGNLSSSQVQVVVDNTYPTANISGPSSDDILGGTINIAGTASDDNLDSVLLEYQESSNPGVWHTIATLGPTNIVNDTIYDWNAGSLNGDYTVRVTAMDKTGKTTSDEVEIRLDNIDPLIDITSPTGELVNAGIVDFTGEISDLNIDNYTVKYGYGIEPARWMDLTSDTTSKTGTIYSWDTPNVKDGYYTIKIDAIDKAGNSSNREFVMTIDNAPAVASIHNPTANQVVKGTVAISGIACDADFTTYNFKKYEISVGTGLVPVQWTTIESLVVPRINETLTNWNTAALADGTYTLKLKSQDISGVTETTRTVIVDNTNPTASITSPTQGETVSGSIDIIGTASDTNLSEYKVYYKHTDSTIWTEIGSGTSTLATWNTVNVGDGSYQIKLWVKDQAGSESEITRDVTVNNVLAVVNDSVAPPTISPNGDGVDDVASIAYTLSESSPVTVKIYKKPQYDSFKWEAKGFGTRYPNQPFTYSISASGTNYPEQSFGWRVDGSGTETYDTEHVIEGDFIPNPDPVYYGFEIIGRLRDNYGHDFGSQLNFSPPFSQVMFVKVLNSYWSYAVGGGGTKNASRVYVYENNTSTERKDWLSSPKAAFWLEPDLSNQWQSFMFFADESKYYSCMAFTWQNNPITVLQFVYFERDSGNVSASDSGAASIKRDGTFASGSDRNYSVTLPAPHGGLISNHSISYTQTTNTGNVSSSMSNTSWSGNTCSGVVNATYNYPGDPWSGSSPGSDSCNALGGTITVGQGESMASKFGTPNEHPDYREYSSFSVSDTNPNVSVWFNNSGTTSTSDPNDYLRASTSYTESWNTSNDPAVGSNGWIKSGEISAPFNYDESSQSFSTEYTPPSNVVLSSWTVNLKNPDGGESIDVELDGTPTAGGNFNIKISDSLLVKTLQYNASTAPGAQSIEWDGKDGNGSYVADGDYIYYIYAGPNIVKKSGVIKVERSSEISSASLSPEYISPDGDGIKDSATIDYTLSETASVNIDVLDESDTVIKSFSAGGNQGANSTSWDGRNNSGTVVEDGEYTIKVNVANGNGALRTEELALVVDNNSLTVGEIAAEQLTSSGNDPVYSPDKSKIAYVKEVSGEKQIFTMNLLTTNNLQLTTNGNNFQSHWSPDGTKITFTSDRSGNNDIWIMDADGSNQKQITSDNDSETSPAFSPDGQKIAYASNRTGQLGINKWNVWTVDLDGTNPAQITADENTAKDDCPTWSPDGKKLAFASDQGGNFDVWSVNLDGSSKIRITSSSETETAPVWSPDGLKIIYTRENDIYLRKLSSGEEVLIAGGENPAWSRDGTEVVYNAADSKIYSRKVCAGALTGVITQPILNQTLTGLAEIRGTALDTNFESYRLEFSPNTMPYSWTELANSSTPVSNGILGVWNTADVADGEYILRLTVSDKAGNNLENTVVVNADNDNWKLTITNLEQITSDEAWDVEPAWSPDGTKLAFSSNRSGNYDIWAMNADGTGLQNITNNSATDVKPAWSPDGTKITFVSDRSGNKDIWVANADGSGVPLQLTTLTIVDTNPTWSPDGSQVAFASNRSGNFDIWLVNSNGTGTPTKLTSDEALDKEPSWSQFGIAFTSERSGDKEIWMIEDISNPNPFRLTYNSAEDKEPNWAPIAIPLSDGSNRPLITFTSTRNDNLDIWVMDTDGIDQSKSLTDYTNVDCNPAWSPDGTRVAYASYKDGNYDIWVMNFGINVTVLGVAPQQSTTLEVPTLIAPEDADDPAYKDVQTIRPTFQWKHHKGDTQEYKIELAENNLFTIVSHSFTKLANSGSPDKPGGDPNLYFFTYSIHEFDPGLDRDTYYWKVTAVGTSESAASEVWSFTVAPQLTLTGVTNYPNPFNPNQRNTTIRYRLGADADSVKIRIYDITGSLVKQIDNCPTDGEGSSIWSKYNDVDWNGCNGRGDLVRNGIYPFEIVARLGDRSVSARGKIAVLK